MASIIPCRSLVSDRFPVLSFVVNVPPDRLFEIACTTDPKLFHTDHKHRRSPSNFFSTRKDGLLRAPAGQATYLLDSEQLRRFAGSQKLYYALGSYGGVRGENPQFTITPDALAETPFIQIAPDFSARALDRSRLGKSPPSAQYGAAAPVLGWGGDDALLSARKLASATKVGTGDVYDDGHDPSLWRSSADPGPAVSRRYPKEENQAVARPAYRAPELEPTGYEDAPDLRRHRMGAGSEPRSVRPDGPGIASEPSRFQSPIVSAPNAEPPGYEDAPDLVRRGGSTGQYGNPALIRRVLQSQTQAPRPRHVTSARTLGEDGTGSDVVGHFEAFNDDPDLCYEPESMSAIGLTNSPELVALEVVDKLRIVERVVKFESESSGRYSATNNNSDGQGLSWGIIQFTQRGGALGEVLRRCRAQNKTLFDSIFNGEVAADELIAVTGAASPDERMATVQGDALWREPWTTRFKKAGQEKEFQRIQNIAAVGIYLEPNLQLAAWLGFDTERALTMLYDRCVNMGNGGGPSWIVNAVVPMDQATRDNALASLGFADLQSFQRSVPALKATGKWNARTQAALIRALADAGSTLVDIPDLATMLQQLVQDAERRTREGTEEQRVTWTRILSRVSALVNDTTMDDSAHYGIP
jgi:hypothetical protein